MKTLRTSDGRLLRIYAAVPGEPAKARVPAYLDDYAYLLAGLLELMQCEFSPKTWKACWEHVVASRSAAEVAAELGISVGSVYVAKSRVLGRLRQELDGLFE